MVGTSRKPDIRLADIAPGDLIKILEEVDAVLPEDRKFKCLMADYWNNKGCFEEYSAAVRGLCQQDCISGSAFGDSAEIRWRKVADKLRAVLIARPGLANIPDIWSIEQCQIRRCVNWRIRSNMLWGTRYLHDKGWVEARIPRPINYPAVLKQSPGFEHAQLFFVEYRDERGRAVIQRRKRLIGYIQPSERERKAGTNGGKSNGR